MTSKGVLATLGLVLAGGAHAATITAWNTTNVAVATTPPPGTSAKSTVHDRPAAEPDAVATGAIVFKAPEASSPGIAVVNDAYELGGPAPKPVAAGCIIASSTANCDSGFQSGKRFKEQVFGPLPVDIVFDVDPTALPLDDTGAVLTDHVGYEVFAKYINATGKPVSAFTVELGFGVGTGFIASTSGDGLSFSEDVRHGPDEANAFSQIPFGMFGDAASSENHPIDGFFDDARSGFTMSFAEDILASTGYYGAYDDVFGDWMSLSDVPYGAGWDDDGDPGTDDFLMAWQLADGTWELRRDIDAMGVPVSIAPLTFSDLASVEAYLGVTLTPDSIKDLANLNVNFGIALAEAVSFEQFTLRLTVAPVPLPMAAPLLLAGLGGLAAIGRRRTG